MNIRIPPGLRISINANRPARGGVALSVEPSTTARQSWDQRHPDHEAREPQRERVVEDVAKDRGRQHGEEQHHALAARHFGRPRDVRQLDAQRERRGDHHQLHGRRERVRDRQQVLVLDAEQRQCEPEHEQARVVWHLEARGLAREEARHELALGHPRQLEALGVQTRGEHARGGAHGGEHDHRLEGPAADVLCDERVRVVREHRPVNAVGRQARGHRDDVRRHHERHGEEDRATVHAHRVEHLVAKDRYHDEPVVVPEDRVHVGLPVDP